MTDLTAPTRVMPASVLLIFAAAGTLLLVDQPFQTNRPVEPPTDVIMAAPSEEFADARLWQDPLQPVYDDWQNIVDSYDAKSSSTNNDQYANLKRLPQTIRDFRLTVQSELDAAINSPSRCENTTAVLVLPVMLQSGNYTNQVELRRRTRYALVTALTSFEFSPDNGSKLGYFLAPRYGPFDLVRDGSQNFRPNPRHPILVGYEWFHPRTMLEQVTTKDERCSTGIARWRRVVVLWLSESDFGSNPMSKLDSLLSFIVRPERGKAAQSDIAIKIIGPTSSQVLAEMNDEASRYIGATGITDNRRREKNTFIAIGQQFSVANAISQSLNPYSSGTTRNLPDEPDLLKGLVQMAMEDTEYDDSAQGASDALENCARALMAEFDKTNPPGLSTSIDTTASCLDELSNIPAVDEYWSESIAVDWVYEINWDRLNKALQKLSENKDPLLWREVESIFIEADDYLDDGLPANSNLTTATACLMQNLQNTDDFSGDLTENIAVCLVESIEPEDESDEDWAVSVADSWIDDISRPAQDAQDVAIRLTEKMADYLDDGLPLDVNQKELTDCIATFYNNFDPTNPGANDTRANECLTHFNADAVDDSDPGWQSTVIGHWVAAARLPYIVQAAENAANLVFKTPRLRSDFVVLVEGTHEYLDAGLPDSVDFGLLAECLNTVLINNIRDNNRLEEGTAGCLLDTSIVGGGQTVVDSDTDWSGSIQREWAEYAEFDRYTTSESQVRSEFSALASTEIFSPRSTMPLWFISGPESSTDPASSTGKFVPNAPDQRFLQHLRKANFPLKRFTSTVARDHETAAVLIEELRLRGLFHKSTLRSGPVSGDSPNHDRIAVIFELDSDYGRAIPVILDCYIKQAISKSDKKGDEFYLKVREDPCSWSGGDEGTAANSDQVFVHSFGYMAGIDGEVLDKGAIKNTTDDNKAGSDPRSRSIENLFDPPSGLELPIGRSQLDFLRRLSDRIRKSDEDLRATTGGRGYRAVGVFGSDIYDKQLILQALHRSLPDTVFFTTDLDASLAHPSQYEWNQNLLVGSSYGLDLRPELFSPRGDSSSRRDTASGNNAPVEIRTTPYNKPQRLAFNLAVETPTMRDSYQTAAFLSAKLALLDSVEHETTLFGREFTPPKPRLFEIGRSGAIDITRVNAELSEIKPDAGCKDASTFAAASRRYQAYDTCIHGPLGWTSHAAKATYQKITKSMALLLPLVIMLLAWARKLSIIDREKQSPEWTSYLWASAIALTATVGLFVWLWTWDNPSDEPWLLFDGISAIPTIALRMIVITYAISTMIIGYGRYHQNNINLAARFNLAEEVPNSWRGMTLNKPDSWFELSSAAWRKEIDQNTRYGESYPQKATDLWLRYRELGKPRARVLRTIFYISFVITLTFIWYFSILREHALVRNLSALDDVVILIMSSVTIIIIFMTTDATRLCQTFIRALSRYDVDWIEDKKDKVFGSMKLHHSLYDRLRCIDMITYRTEVITPLIVLPFIVILLLLIARSTLFDGWEWNPPLIIIYIALSIHLLLRSFLLQREAESARDRIMMKLNRLKNDLLDEFYEEDQRDLGKKHLSQIENVMDYISGLKRGAFVPWFRHPMVQAILVPFGGLGTLAILEAIV